MLAVERLLQHVLVASETAAALLDGSVLTYQALGERSARFAGALKGLGVRPGDRVAHFGGTSLPGLIALVAIHRIGAIFVPVNPRYRAEELSHILADSEARLLLCSDRDDARAVLAAVEAPAALERVLSVERDVDALTAAAPSPHEGPLPQDEDTALLIYTSGTTGRSKGVQLSFRAIERNIGALTRAWRFSPEDRLSLQLPLFHVHGLCIGVYGTLLHGMTALLARRFDPAVVIDDFRERGASVFMGVPTLYSRLLEHLAAHPDDAAALQRGRLFTAGSAPLSASDLFAFERLTGHRILERYGMSETLITLSNPYEGERRPGSVGLPVAGCELQVLDDEGNPVPAGKLGELVVCGDSLMTGYWRDANATAAAFRERWFLTGDMARLEADGYVTIVGRKSTDFLKSGGFKISTRELEDVLRDHPQVVEVAVIGVPDPIWGERIVVAAVPRGAATEAELLAELQARSAQHLADYKKPRGILLVDELPKNAMGKVQKAKLVEQALARAVNP